MTSNPPFEGESPEGAAEVVDARGLLCPLPVVRLGERMRRVAAGEEVLLLADDPMAEEDVRLWAAGHGHEIVTVERHGPSSRILIRRAPPRS
ncbi:sulfurtransferase TusA family protein [bacterium]|nr:sulfurtransferase TusA family protein [bacterium]